MTVETRYVTSGEVFVAYQISGQSGPDLLVAPGFVSHLEQMWENPNAARLFHALGGFPRRQVQKRPREKGLLLPGKWPITKPIKR